MLGQTSCEGVLPEVACNARDGLSPSPQAVELIRWGQERNIRVTAEVCPHHLSLTEDAVEGYNTNAKMNPPLRTTQDVAALQEAVRDGTIDLVATDHAPHHYDEKEREFSEAPTATVRLETALAVLGLSHFLVLEKV